MSLKPFSFKNQCYKPIPVLNYTLSWNPNRPLSNGKSLSLGGRDKKGNKVVKGTKAKGKEGNEKQNKRKKTKKKAQCAKNQMGFKKNKREKGVEKVEKGEML